MIKKYLNKINWWKFLVMVVIINIAYSLGDDASISSGLFIILAMFGISILIMLEPTHLYQTPVYVPSEEEEALTKFWSERYKELVLQSYDLNEITREQYSSCKDDFINHDDVIKNIPFPIDHNGADNDGKFNFWLKWEVINSQYMLDYLCKKGILTKK